jgi:phage-related protein
MNLKDKYIRALQEAGFIKSTPELIGEFIGFLVIIGLIAWGMVAFFSLSWGQALLISWMYNQMIVVFSK